MLAMPGSHDAATAELDGNIYGDTLTGLHFAQNSITIGGFVSLASDMIPNSDQWKENLKEIYGLTAELLKYAKTFKILN